VGRASGSSIANSTRRSGHPNAMPACGKPAGTGPRPACVLRAMGSWENRSPTPATRAASGRGAVPASRQCAVQGS
jgi:hypothetical protein